MSQTPREEFLNYVIRLGDHINTIYNRLREVETKVNEISEQITKIKDFAILGEDLKLPDISEKTEERVLSVIENPYTKKRTIK